MNDEPHEYENEKSKAAATYIDGNVSSPDPQANPALPDLLAAKQHSDVGNYAAKTDILRRLMDISPQDWVVDSPRGKYYGVTHVPTGFKLHMPVAAIPSPVLRKPDDNLYRYVTDKGEGSWHAGKRDLPPELADEAGKQREWLQRPELEPGDYESWFTPAGRDQYEQTLKPVHDKYLKGIKRISKPRDDSEPAYADKHQLLYRKTAAAEDTRPYRDRVEVYARNPKGLILGGIYDNDRTHGVFGGGVEPGEDHNTAAVREMLEESGHALRNPKPIDIPPVTAEWLPPYFTPQQAERSKQYRGSRTHFISGDTDDEPAQIPTEPSKLEDIRFRALQEALAIQGTPEFPNLYASRRAALERLSQISPEAIGMLKAAMVCLEVERIIKQSNTALVRRITQGLLSHGAINRAAGAMEPGAFRFIKNLGRGQMNVADHVVGNLGGGHAGEFVRKLPAHQYANVAEGYQGLKPYVERMNKLFPTGGDPLVVPYPHIGDRGAFQEFANGKVDPKFWADHGHAIRAQMKDLHPGNVTDAGQIMDFVAPGGAVGWTSATSRISPNPGHMFGLNIPGGYDRLANQPAALMSVKERALNNSTNNNIRKYWTHPHSEIPATPAPPVAAAAHSVPWSQDPRFGHLPSLPPVRTSQGWVSPPARKWWQIFGGPGKPAAPAVAPAQDISKLKSKPFTWDPAWGSEPTAWKDLYRSSEAPARKWWQIFGGPDERYRAELKAAAKKWDERKARIQMAAQASQESPKLPDPMMHWRQAPNPAVAPGKSAMLKQSSFGLQAMRAQIASPAINANNSLLENISTNLDQTRARGEKMIADEYASRDWEESQTPGLGMARLRATLRGKRNPSVVTDPIDQVVFGSQA